MNKVSKRIALLGVISPALFAVGAMAQPLQVHSTLAGNNLVGNARPFAPAALAPRSKSGVMTIAEKLTEGDKS